MDDGAWARELPPGLWDRLRLDPVRSPEHIALAAARTFGPQAEQWAAEKRARFKVAPKELAQMAKKRHATLARFEGAATGVGGVVTMVPDIVALAWIQSRLVFYVAAAYGYDATDPMRPAEALVLFDFYSDPIVGAARARRDRLDRRRGVHRLAAQARRGARAAAGEAARDPVRAQARGTRHPRHRDPVQLGRQRAPDARARRQGDPLLRRLIRARRRRGSRRPWSPPTRRCRGTG